LGIGDSVGGVDAPTEAATAAVDVGGVVVVDDDDDVDDVDVVANRMC
jgi:hypothetical protein